MTKITPHRRPFYFGSGRAQALRSRPDAGGRNARRATRAATPSGRRATGSPSGPKHRNAALDALRGLAIVLMIIDHVAYYFFDIAIEPTNIRMLTRLSMPLFCGLMGYFLAGRAEVHWRRFYQLCLAACLVNVAFFTVHHKFEILASLLVAYALFIALRGNLVWGVAAVALTPWDITAAWFDYPLPVVIACVAQGMILGRWGWQAGLLSGCGLMLGWSVVAYPTAYILLYVLPSSLLIAAAAAIGGKEMARPAARWLNWLSWLSWLGRYPLSVYVTQYYLIFALAS